MQKECVICFNNINNDTESNTKYNFHQECNCFYNVHSNCLIEWVKKYKSCIYCHKPLSYTINSNFSNINIRTETNSLVINQHQPFIREKRCCIIL